MTEECQRAERELLQRFPPDDCCERAIRDFVDRVNRRAETEMMETGALEGAHHRAIVAEMATWPEEPAC